VALEGVCLEYFGVSLSVLFKHCSIFILFFFFFLNYCHQKTSGRNITDFFGNLGALDGRVLSIS
jgi:hypothetical protein